MGRSDTRVGRNLFSFEIKHSAGIVVLLVVIDTVVVRNFKSVCHEIGTGEGFALKLQRCVVDAVKLFHTIGLCRIETCHFYAW